MIANDPIALKRHDESGGSSKVLAEFEGRVECPLASGDATIVVAQDELLVATSFGQVEIPYSDIAFFVLEDFRIRVRAPFGDVMLSRLGRSIEWLHAKLADAYNDAVLRALLVEGDCLFQASGFFHAYEPLREFGGACSVRLFSDCLCLLPANENARRIPLCFVTNLQREGHVLVVALTTGERYEVSRMGRDLDNLERTIAGCLRDLRESTAAWLRELAPNISAVQVSSAARLMPLGTAALAGALVGVAPELFVALEAKAMESRIGATYPWLKDFCGGSDFALGAKPAPSEDELAQDELVVWMVAFGREKALAAVELALPDGEAAATYLYRVSGDWPAFARQVDRALEAAGFRRGPVILSDDDLARPEHAADAMLVKRTPALGFLRSCLAGRAIHSSWQRWLADIERAAGGGGEAE